MSAFPGHRKRIKKLIRSVKRGIAGQAATAIDNARLFQAAGDGDLLHQRAEHLTASAYLIFFDIAPGRTFLREE
jgi:GAF domain-containing protein